MYLWLRSSLGLAVLYFGLSDLARGEDVVPPLQLASPRLRFHTGQVENGQPLILKSLPSIPGKASDWYVAQWQQESYLRPEELSGGPAGPWQFDTPDRHSLLRIDRRGSGTTYTLAERDGILTAGGGANLFLATNATGTASFATPMILSIDYRVASASVKADNVAAVASGTVQAMAFIGLGLTFYDQAGRLSQFVFMQLPLEISRAIPPGPGIICTLNNGHPSLLYSPDLKRPLFGVDTVVQHRRYDLSALVRAMLSHSYPCSGVMLNWSEEQRSPAAWRLGGVYIGLEVQNRDLRGSAATHDPQGHASMGLELSGFSISQQANADTR